MFRKSIDVEEALSIKITAKYSHRKIELKKLKINKIL
jgi:hypothetical protein